MKHRLKQKIISVILSVILIFVMTPSLSAAADDPSIGYIDENGLVQSVAAQKMTSSVSSLTTGWYYAEGTTNISQTVSVTGSVYLILEDTCIMTISAMETALRVPQGNSLYIYAQSIGSDMGKLIASSSGQRGAAIGGIEGEKNGEITIIGGNIKANSGPNGAGIGSAGAVDQGGAINIHGGIVTATGGAYAPGIGGRFNGGEVNITGGIVTAIGGVQAAGIGGGQNNSGGTVVISGEGTTVTAKGDIGANDIGSGISNGDGGSLTVINGATLVLEQSGTDAVVLLDETCIVNVNGTYKFGNFYDSVTLSPSSLAFNEASSPYVIEPLTLTINNQAAIALKGVNVSLSSGVHFEVVEGLNSGTIPARGMATLKVCPKEGLDCGSYSDSLIITSTNGFKGSVQLHLKVLAPVPEIDIDYINEQLTGMSPSEFYYVAADYSDWIITDENGAAPIRQEWFGQTIKISVLSPESMPRSLTFSRPAAPKVGMKPVSARESSDGGITGLTSAMNTGFKEIQAGSIALTAALSSLDWESMR